MWELIVSVPDHCSSFYCAGKRHMNLLSLSLKQQLRSCDGSLERLKMWKIKPGFDSQYKWLCM